MNKLRSAITIPETLHSKSGDAGSSTQTDSDSLTFRKIDGTNQVSTDAQFNDLVSVVIPCYNHGNFIADAIDSVLSQNHKNVEVIVVDDGSTDCTKRVVEIRYADVDEVKYIYQNNQGLSAARNTGIDHSAGDYLVFLDADDWLIGDALRINLLHLKHDPTAGFVSGGHLIVKEKTGFRFKRNQKIDGDYFQLLLMGNYIGMHGTVMFPRWVFEEFRYDISLKASEDYDIYLKIARKYSVRQHTEIIAAYRFHDSNMSDNSYKMYKNTLTVLRKQRASLRSPTDKKCWNKGMSTWKAYYGSKLLLSIQNKPTWPITTEMIREHFVTFQSNRLSYTKYLVKMTFPAVILKWFYKNVLDKEYVPYPGCVDLGDFRRVTPFSTDFGYSRGGPVDRYYIEKFLKEFESLIKDRVLEIGDNEYTLKYGGEKVKHSDILHVDENNPKATFVGDLSNAPQLPDESFDCIILTQTLHLIYDFKGAIQTCRRILKPGGVLLLTVPGISHIQKGEWGKYWMWSFTSHSIKRLLNEVFEDGTNVSDHKSFEYKTANRGGSKNSMATDILVNVYGNVLTASAFLYAMGVSDLSKQELDSTDPQYQLIITARVIKSV